MNPPSCRPKNKHPRNKIRMNQTNQNPTKPHFTENNDHFRQAKNIINNIRETFVVHTSKPPETHNLIVPCNTPETPMKKIRERVTKTIQPDNAKFDDIDDMKTLFKSPNFMCYEYSKEYNRCVQEALMNTFANINEKNTNKDKIEELEIAYTAISVSNDGKHRKHKHKHRVRPRSRQTPESAKEYEIKKVGDKFQTVPKEKRRKKRISKSQPKGIDEIVSSTIEKLNTVYDSVQKVIGESGSTEGHNTNLEKSPTHIAPIPEEQEAEQFYKKILLAASALNKHTNTVKSFKPKQEMSTNTLNSRPTSAGLKDIIRIKSRRLKVIQEEIKEAEEAIETQMLLKKLSVFSMKNFNNINENTHVNFISTP